jgi:hypothetical protein
VHRHDGLGNGKVQNRQVGGGIELPVAWCPRIVPLEIRVLRSRRVAKLEHGMGVMTCMSKSDCGLGALHGRIESLFEIKLTFMM